MLNIKKGLMIMTSLGVAVTLTACNDNKEKSNDSKATTNQKSDNKTNENSNSSLKKNEDSVDELSAKTKMALAFFADGIDDYMLTKDEVLTGVFEDETGGEAKKKQLYKLLLIREKSVNNAPEDMAFYTVYPSKGSFASVIGVSKDKIFVGGTQGTLDYKEMTDAGNEYSIEELYNRNKQYSSLDELAKKIEVTNKDPMADDKTRKEFEANENPNTNAHMRTQVYQMIEDLDGHPIDTNKYLVDNVKMTKEGKWYVNYRNKHAEIVGTYTMKDNKIVKKDADGKIIKEKKIDK